jgi:hypothetical protein
MALPKIWFDGELFAVAVWGTFPSSRYQHKGARATDIFEDAEKLFTIRFDLDTLASVLGVFDLDKHSTLGVPTFPD